MLILKKIIVFIFLLISTGIFITPGVAAIEVCDDVMVIFARGSGQQQNNIVQQQQTYKFFSEIEARKPGNISLAKLELLYPARGGYGDYAESELSFFGTQTGGQILKRFNINGPGQFRSSVMTGVANAKLLIETEAVRCPNQRIVLGGYSQGANVIGDALYQLNSVAASKIVYVGLFGDPKFKADSYAARGNFERKNGGILEARKQEFPSIFSGRLHSWCRKRDGICENNLARAMGPPSEHPLYTELEIPIAANEAAIRLKQYYSGFNTKQIDIRNLDTTKPVDIVFVADWSIQQSGIGNSAWRSNFAITTLPVIQEFSSDFRVGFTRYWNTDISPLNSVPLSADMTLVNSSLQAMNNPNAGSGATDAVLYGLNTALNGHSWNQDATKHIVLMARGHYSSPEPLTGLTVSNIINNAQSKNIKIHSAISTTALDPLPAQAIAIRDAHRLITNATMGRAEFYTTFDGTLLGVPDLLRKIAGQPVTYTGPLHLIRLNVPVRLSAGGAFDPNSIFTKYEWDWNGDGIYELETTGPIATHTFTTNFIGNVKVRTTSNDGDEAIVTLPVSANNAHFLATPPTAPRNIKSKVLSTTTSTIAGGVNVAAVTHSIQLTWDSPSSDNGSTIEAYIIKNQAGEVLGIVPATTTDVQIDNVELGSVLSVEAANAEGVGLAATSQIALEPTVLLPSTPTQAPSTTQPINVSPYTISAPDILQNITGEAVDSPAFEEPKVRTYLDTLARIPQVGTDPKFKWWYLSIIGLPLLLYAQRHKRRVKLIR